MPACSTYGDVKLTNQEIFELLQGRALEDGLLAEAAQEILVDIDKHLIERKNLPTFIRPDDPQEADDYLVDVVLTKYIPKELRDYDWQEAFGYAEGFFRFDVMSILYQVDGENDAYSWIGVFQLRDKKYAAVRAGCDYTGWD
jgi:hypothetical protein